MILLHQILISSSPERASGGSLPGLGYGMVGAVLLGCVGMLSLHRRLARWGWIGSRAGWLRGHVWLALLSCAALGCHCNFHFGGTFTTTLSVVYFVVIGTGILGVGLQWLIPRLMTQRISSEAPFEQIPRLCSVLLQEADQLIDEVCGPLEPTSLNEDRTTAARNHGANPLVQLREFHETCLRPFLTSPASHASPLTSPYQAEALFNGLCKIGGLTPHLSVLDRLASLCERRRLLWEQEKLHYWLHAWLLIHVPASGLLLILGVWHVATALYY